MEQTSVPFVQLVGAGAFGMVIGWYVYYINRFRKGDVQLSDVVTLIGIIGGSAVLALFPQASDLFGAYGIGLAIGFFLYFVVLLILVTVSAHTSGSFGVEWFLDGRRRWPVEGYSIPEATAPTSRPMGAAGGAGLTVPGHAEPSR